MFPILETLWIIYIRVVFGNEQNKKRWYTPLVMKEVVVNKNSEGQKIEKFVRKYLPEAPLGFIFKAFRKKDIKINGHWVKKDAIVHEGDVVRIYVSDSQLEDFKKPRPVTPKPFPYPIVYEDENILIVDKPKGLLVYGDDKGSRETLGNAVLDYLCYEGAYDPSDAFTPSPAHRLDRNTSGLVCYGKTDVGLKALTDLFKERDQIHKVYLALLVGDLQGKGQINKPLWKNEKEGRVYVKPLSEGGKTAITEYEVKKRFGDYTLAEVNLLTGRTHQIRVHFASIGHPLVGDEKYGDYEDCRKVKKLIGLESQFLHAHKLDFLDVKGVLLPLKGKSLVSNLTKDEILMIETLTGETLE